MYQDIANHFTVTFAEPRVINGKFVPLVDRVRVDDSHRHRKPHKTDYDRRENPFQVLSQHIGNLRKDKASFKRDINKREYAKKRNHQRNVLTNKSAQHEKNREPNKAAFQVET